MQIVEVVPAELWVGDRIVNAEEDVYVDDLYHDPEGTWIDYSDGDGGYPLSETRKIKVERVYAGEDY